MTFAVVACEDSKLNEIGPKGRSAFGRYVAIGTSVSMGVRNGYNAVTAETQTEAWPALLARQAGAANFRLPLFRPGGCLSPSAAPISLGINLLGRAQASPLQPDTSSCAGLVAGIILPANNVAITGHKVVDALTMTPESAAVNKTDCSTGTCVTDLPRRKIMPLVLLPKQTQVTAMLAQNPTFVSVELGANDVLSVAGGLALQVPGGSITPDTTFTRAYNQVIDSVKKTNARALLVGLPDSIQWAAGLRKGSELFADSLGFANGAYVTISSDCNTINANNYIFVPARVFAAFKSGRDSLAKINPVTFQPAPRPLFTCFDGGPTAVDYALTPAEVTIANTAITAFNATIQAAATANGYAYSSLSPWLHQTKPPFSVSALLSSTQPYGKWIGLDGVHPTKSGQIAIANAAISAINAKYGFTIPVLPAP